MRVAQSTVHIGKQSSERGLQSPLATLPIKWHHLVMRPRLINTAVSQQRLETPSSSPQHLLAADKYQPNHHWYCHILS